MALSYAQWWLALAVLLLILEMGSGTFFLLWLSAPAFVIAGLTWLAPTIAWQWQLTLFAIGAVGAVLGWRHFRPGINVSARADDGQLLNQRGAALIGREFTLEETLVDGQGRLRVGDSWWQAQAHRDLAGGTKVRVIGVEGATLRIEEV